MDKKTEVYVDTSAFIAFTDGSDTYHPLFYRLFADPPRLVTTSLVISEGHGWFLKYHWQFTSTDWISHPDRDFCFKYSRLRIVIMLNRIRTIPRILTAEKSLPRIIDPTTPGPRPRPAV